MYHTQTDLMYTHQACITSMSVVPRYKYMNVVHMNDMTTCTHIHAMVHVYEPGIIIFTTRQQLGDRSPPPSKRMVHKSSGNSN